MEVLEPQQMTLGLAVLAVVLEAAAQEMAVLMAVAVALLRVEHRVLDKVLQQDALGIPCCTLVAVVVALPIALAVVLADLAVAAVAVTTARQGHPRVHQTELRTPEVAAVA